LYGCPPKAATCVRSDNDVEVDGVEANPKLVTISFEEATSQGGELSKEDYTVEIRSKWGSFYNAPANCKETKNLLELDENPFNPALTRYACEINTDDLLKGPFSLSVGDRIVVQVNGRNVFGYGPYGSNTKLDEECKF
jgi:hypothetical protein